MNAVRHFMEAMTEPLRGPNPDRFRTNVYGSRWYIDPLPADEHWPATTDQWPSVTTIKKAWSKPFRKKLPTGETVPLDAYWAATFTTKNLDAINALAGDDDAAIALICGAGRRTLNNAAERGQDVHTVLEELAGGVTPNTILASPEATPFVPACAAFIKDWRPQWIATEFVTINRTLGFGGTADAILAIEPPWGGRYVCVTDWKSRGGQHGCYEEEVAQVGGYSLAEYIIVQAPDGHPIRVPMPPIDGGLVVSLTADGYEAYPIDLDQAQTAFRDMLTSWRGHRDGQKAARKARQQPLMLPSAHTPETAVVPELDPDRVDWVRDRINAIKAAGHAQALADCWTLYPEIPTFKKGGPTTDQDLAKVIEMCEYVEAQYGLPFGVSDPTTPKQTKSKKRETA